MNDTLCKSLLIRGRVQGVGFRYQMAEEARRLGVAGWVRNRRDGSVEATIAGTPQAVDSMIAWARRGPPAAGVTLVEITEGSGNYARFDMLPTE